MDYYFSKPRAVEFIMKYKQEKATYKVFDSLDPAIETGLKDIHAKISELNRLNKYVNVLDGNERIELLLEEVNKDRKNKQQQPLLFKQLKGMIVSPGNLPELKPFIDKMVQPGGSLYDVVETIRKNGASPNLANIFINPYPDKKINYTQTHPTQMYGACELWGHRVTQEDRIVMGNFDNHMFSNLSDIQWRSALINTVSELQKETEELPGNQGATICANIIIGNKVINTNLGDTESFLVRIKANGLVDTSTLYGELHSPSTAKEKARIEKAGGKITLDKSINRIVIPGTNIPGLSVSGALGDRIFGATVTHNPVIKITDIQLEEGEKAFVINACDGLREGLSKLKNEVEQSISAVVSQSQDLPPEEIAKRLALKSLNAGSNDNISVIVVPFNPNDTSQTYTAVFDGHGGDSISDMLYVNFIGTLSLHLEKELSLRLKEKPVEEPQYEDEEEDELQFSIDTYNEPMEDKSEVKAYAIPSTSNVSISLQRHTLEETISVRDRMLRLGAVLDNAWKAYQAQAQLADKALEAKEPSWFQNLVVGKGFFHDTLLFLGFETYVGEAQATAETYANRESTRSNLLANANESFENKLNDVFGKLQGILPDDSEIKTKFESIKSSSSLVEAKLKRNTELLKVEINEQTKITTVPSNKAINFVSPSKRPESSLQGDSNEKDNNTTFRL